LASAVAIRARSASINSSCSCRVTVRSAGQAANTLQGSDALVISGGSLTVGAASTFGGNLELDAGTTLTLGGATLLIGHVSLSGGTINLQSGTLQFNSRGSSTGGAFQVGQGATVHLGNIGTLTGTYTGSGQGRIALDSGDLFIGPAGATLDFAPGLFDWSGRLITASSAANPNAVLTNSGSMTIGTLPATPMASRAAIPGGDPLTKGSTSNRVHPFSGGGGGGGGFGATPSLGSPLNNTGTITVTSTGVLLPIHDGTVTNQAGGTIQLAPGAELGSPLINGPALITNAGLLRLQGGSGTANIDNPFSNTGTVEVDSGTLAITKSVAQVSGSTLTAGTWEALGGSTIQFPGGTNLTTNQAGVTLGGSGASIPALDNLAGNAGSFTLTGGATFTTAGDLDNTGTLTIGPASTLNVQGAYTQGPSATLDVQLGGTPASGQFGQLIASGAATLNGTLQAEVVGGYQPTVNDQFTVLTYPSETGTFSTFNMPLGGGVQFQAAVNAGNVTLTGQGTPADLAVASIDAVTPGRATPGQNLSVTYTVTNRGTTTPGAAWTDAVFLSPSSTLSPAAVLLGRVPHSGIVSAGGHYQASLTRPLPALTPGNYFVLVETDSGGQVPDTNRANNVLASSGTVQVTIPALPLTAAGSPVNPATGTIAAGQTALFQVTIPAGDDVNITLGTASAGAAELLVGYRAVPTEATALAQAFIAGQAQQEVGLHATQAGTYLVAVVGQGEPGGVSPGSGTGTPFTLTAQETGLGVQSFSPSSGSNAGFVTITITGTRFTPGTTARLVGPGNTTTAATGLFAPNSTTLTATFDLTTLPAGAYQLQVQDGNRTVTAAGAFTVNTGPAGQLVTHLSVPSALRPGKPVTVTVDYQNVGGTDLPAPILELSADSGSLQLAGQAGFTTTGFDGGGPNIQFVATNPSGSAGVLPPGARGQATFTFVGSSSAGQVHFNLEQLTPGGILGWAKIKDQLQPAGVDPAAWNAIFNNFLGQVGATTEQYQFVMDQDASYFQSIGEPTQDVQRLLNFEIEKAGGFGAIARRYRTGAFGLGNTDPVTNFAVTGADGSVTLHLTGGFRKFTPLAGGGFQAQPGDTGTLTQSGGAYQPPSPRAAAPISSGSSTAG
jgi:hypothetical protein